MDEAKNLPALLKTMEADLLKTLASVPPEKIDTVPFEGSWTAGQVVEHILKFTTGVPHLLDGPSKTTTRKPDEKIDSLRKTFMDFDTKMKSPDFLVPSKGPHRKEDLERKVKTTMDDIIMAIQSSDLQSTPTELKLPIGEVTRLELSYFILFHTSRHVHQLKNISMKLQDAKKPA